MNKIKVLFALAGFSIAVGMAVPVQAGGNHPGDDDGHNGGGGKHNKCKEGFDPVRVNDAECEHIARKIDKKGNDDGWVCERSEWNQVEYRDNKRKKNHFNK